MANREGTSSPEFHCIFVETSLNTRLALLVHKDEIISDFKDNLRKEHKQVFPEIGEINVSAFKVKRRRQFYHLSDSMIVCKAFDRISGNWFIYVDAVRVEEVITIMAADQNGSKLELIEEKKEITIGMHTKDLSLEEGFETEVAEKKAEKKTRKRKILSSYGKKSRKKLMIDVNQSAVASGSCVVSPREQVDDIVTGAIGKDIGSDENLDISMGENQQTSDADRQLEEKILTVDSELVDNAKKDVPDSETPNGALEKLDDLMGATGQDLGNGEKTAELVKIDQEKDLQPASELADGKIISRDDERGEGSRLAPSSVDNLQTAELVTQTEKQLESSSGLTTGPATEKRKRKKSSKDHINQSSATTTPLKEIVNEAEKVSGSIDHKHATTLADAIQNEIGDKLVYNVGSREAALLAADEIQAENNPRTFVQESKTLDNIGKFTDQNKSREPEVSKEKVDIDTDQAKSVKSTKKKSSRKSKTSAKEDTLVDAGVQNVEPIKVVDGEGPDNVIRNVLDSLQQRNEAEENVDKSVKKSSKRSKKKHSSNTVEPQVLSVEVNNAAQNEAPPTNKPEDTDALFTPAKKDTEKDASHLEKSIQVVDNTEDDNPSKQILKENDEMADNFGSSQKKDDIVGGGNKQDQVTGGAKSKKGGSIDGSVKPKERKSRVQPASSGTSQLQSKAKNDRSESKVNHSNASVRGTVNNKKEAVKKRSDSVTVNKSKMNFFKDADMSNSTDDESKTTSNVSTKSPSDSSADDDSDVTSMSRNQGNNISGGTKRFSGSLRDILRSSKSYKKAKLTASQSQPDDFDIEGLALDFVPDSQAN